MILIRLFTQTFSLALGQIWANKVRALLTTLGIIIAVTSVITIVAATGGLKSFVLDQMSSMGVSKVWIFPRVPPGQRERFSMRQVRMTEEQINAIEKECPSIESITPVMQMVCKVQVGERSNDFVTVQGVRPAWHAIEDRTVLMGRPLMPVDEEERRQVCIVNDKALAEFAMDSDPTGTTILVDGRRFLVVGVIETKMVTPMFGGGEAQSEVFIPFNTGNMMRPRPRLYAVATTGNPELFADAKAEVGAVLRRMRGLRPEDPDTFGVEAIQQYIQQFQKLAAGISVFLVGLVSIALLVGGIGIMNIMLVSVSERTREIGLRKAVGAQPAVILFQFLVEAVTLCLIGCVIGIVVGQGIVLLLKFIPNSPMAKAEVPMWAILLAVGFSAGTGLIFGMFPAIKAARLNPIDALRHE
jgi:putative ABC transport system permease protein